MAAPQIEIMIIRAAIIAVLIGLAGQPAWAAKKWRTYENCTLIPHDANDGDSFHVRVNKRHYIFRLYFADTPETDDSLPERVAEQAAYFGLDPKTTIQVGKQAKEFTANFLKNGFTVYSRLQDALGRSDRDRDYAFVVVGDKDLATELVRNGLARVYGTPTDHPDGTPQQNLWWRLKSAEREAKQMRRGAWGMPQAPTNPFARATPVAAPGANPTLPAAAAAAPELEEQSLVLPQSIIAFSLRDPGQQVGILPRGTVVRVLRAESPTMARIRFSEQNGNVFEAQCRRADLGL